MWRSIVLVAAAVALVACTPSGPGIIKLGTYDYFTDESTPVTFNGRLLMFESIVHASPQWAGYWIPAFANCSCYFRVRDLYSGAGGWCVYACVCCMCAGMRTLTCARPASIRSARETITLEYKSRPHTCDVHLVQCW